MVVDVMTGEVRGCIVLSSKEKRIFLVGEGGEGGLFP